MSWDGILFVKDCGSVGVYNKIYGLGLGNGGGFKLIKSCIIW